MLEIVERCVWSSGLIIMSINVLTDPDHAPNTHPAIFEPKQDDLRI